MQLGFYHVYWEELTRLFPREQIQPLQNKELADVDDIMGKVFTFLGMRKWISIKLLFNYFDNLFYFLVLKESMGT